MRESTESDTAGRILRYLEQWGPLTERAIGDELMCSSETVARLVARLLRDGQIRIVGHDRYGEPRYAA